MLKKLEDKVENMMLSEDERKTKELERQAETVTTSILSSGFMMGLTQALMTKTAVKHQEKLTKLNHDFTIEMAKNTQIHEEISRIQDNVDAVIDATLSSGAVADSASLNRILDFLDNTSATVVAIRHNDDSKRKKKEAKKKEVIIETDYEEV